MNVTLIMVDAITTVSTHREAIGASVKMAMTSQVMKETALVTITDL